MGGVCAGAVAVARTEAAEQDLEAELTAAHAASVAQRVGEGAHVLVEVCADDVERAALPVPVIVESPSEAATTGIAAVLTVGAATLGEARRAGRSACWTAFDRVVPRAGSVRVRLAEVEGVGPLHVTARVHVRGAPRSGGPLARWLALVGALGVASSLALRAVSPGGVARTLARWKPLVALVVGVAAAVGAAQAVRYVGDDSALHGLARGLLLGGVETALALGLAMALTRRTELRGADVLGMVSPRGGSLALLLSPAAGAFCAVGAVVALRLLPSPPGAAPIEAFVARPSGMLAFALLAAVVPLAEEMFFRGLVYGNAQRALGMPAAFALSVGLFLAAHAPQDWGSWGGLVAVALVGLTTTTLRAVTGSLAAPMLAHLVYNALLTASVT